MGIDAQRSGASERPDRAVEVRRAQGATTKAIPVWIVEEEQRRDRPQDPCALRVAAAGGRLLRCGGPTIYTHIARPAAHCLRPPRPRNAALFTFTTDGRARPPSGTTSQGQRSPTVRHPAPAPA